MGISSRISLGLVAGLAIQGVGSYAGITPTAQVRTLEANASATLPTIPPKSDSKTDLDAALGLGPFLGEVEAEATVFAAPPLDLRYAVSTATQSSTLGPIVITAEGTASVSLTLLPGSVSGGSSQGDAESFFDVFFSIDTKSNFQLSGVLDTQALVTGGAAIPLMKNDLSLWDVDNSVVLFDSLTQDEAFSVSGVLEPGNYRLMAMAEVEANQASILTQSRSVTGLSSFQLRMLVTNVPETGTVLAWMGFVGLAGWTVCRRRCSR